MLVIQELKQKYKNQELFEVFDLEDLVDLLVVLYIKKNHEIENHVSILEAKSVQSSTKEKRMAVL